MNRNIDVPNWPDRGVPRGQATFIVPQAVAQLVPVAGIGEGLQDFEQARCRSAKVIGFRTESQSACLRNADRIRSEYTGRGRDDKLPSVTRILLSILYFVLLLPLSLHGQYVTSPIARFETSLGDIFVELLPADAPATVENFLGYVRRGVYNNSIIHRSVPGFIIQGGGYTYENGVFRSLPASAPVRNEFKVSNVRGTLAMAKLGFNPDSATNQWFFNLTDNSQNLNNQNSGFTVFGRIISGIEVMDRIANVQTFRINSNELTNIPLLGYNSGQAVLSSNIIFIRSITTMDSLPSTEVMSSDNTSGRQITRTFHFSHVNGADDLTVVNVLINTALDGRAACYIGFDRANKLVVLLNDAGDDASVLALPTTSTIGNSQCSINGSGIIISQSGPILSLTVPFVFSESFAGTKAVYVAARDRSGGNSGWSPVGTHSVSILESSPLAVRALLPSPTASHGTIYPMTAQFRDASSFFNLRTVQILINSALDGANACYVGFDHIGNWLYIVGNDGVLQTTPIRLNAASGGVASIENDQCRIVGAGSTFIGIGATLTVTLQVEFKQAFVGRRIIYGGVQTLTGTNSGWQVLGGISVK